MATMTKIPAELLADILALVPWGVINHKNLRLTCRRFNDILYNYESSIAREIISKQCPPSSQLRFPSIFEDNGTKTGYLIVYEVQRRWKVLEDIEKSCSRVRERNGKQAGWMTPRLVGLQGIGLCLLFRMCDAGSNEARIALLTSLPPMSLAVLLFTLMMSIQQLRAEGPDILNIQAPVQVAACRGEIELACQELILQNGGDYLLSLLNHDPRAVATLEKEYGGMEARQMPRIDGTASPPTLISVLRRTLSTKLRCDWKDNHERMWELLGSDKLRNICESDALTIIHGETIHV